MTTVVIFMLGVFVTAITITAIVLVGISEAADPALSRPENLAAWERSLVDREREKQGADRDAG